MNQIAESAAPQLTGSVEIRDYSLWTKHIHGNRQLAELIEGLNEGAIIHLRIGGCEGVWTKKRNGTTGIPTPGLKPVGAVREIWFDWFKTRRGELVDIELISIPGKKTGATSVGEKDDAAWQAFLGITKAGWRLSAPMGDRDELHGRDI